jgi:serine protease AprX
MPVSRPAAAAKGPGGGGSDAVQWMLRWAAREPVEGEGAMVPGRWTAWRKARGLAVLLVISCLAAPASSAALRGEVAAKFDPHLLPVLSAGGAEPVSAWVSFGDKGETGPGDLVRRLAEAEAALDPHARARRERAGVTPLVDYLDLPVHPPYLESLRALGLAPYGPSRWSNGVAVRATGGQLVALAGLSCVARLAPVERAVPMRDEPAGSAAGAREAGPASAGAAIALDYGLTASQLTQIGVPALHDSGYTGVGVRICVLDNGFNYHATHPALKNADILATRDFVRGVDDPTDLAHNSWFTHGTNTLSCIAGDQPGRYVGAAPGATFLLGRTEYNPTEKPVEMIWWGMGAEWADSAGADIISSSVGYSTFPDSAGQDYTYSDMDGRTTLVSRAAQIAASKGILVVNSVGNAGNQLWRYLVAPSDVNGDSLIAVGAVDAAGAPASFSSYGPSADGRVKPDLAARGVSAWVAMAADSGYTQMSGTSFSCPLLAGLAACVMQARPTWSPTRVIRGLRLTASQATAPDDRVGYGIPDGAAVLWDTASVPGLPPFTLGLRLTGSNPLTALAPSTRVDFGVGAGAGEPRLRVFDAQGRLVARDLASSPNLRVAENGLPRTATWDGRGSDGRLLRAGLYFITLEAGGRRAAVRVISLR